MQKEYNGYKTILAIDSGSNIGLKRKENQDAFLTFLGEEFSLFAVCDGMGGHNAGKLAVEVTLNAIKVFIVDEFSKYSDYKLLLNDSLNFANSKVIEVAKSKPEYSNMGSTAVVLLIVDNKAFVAHSGDSRLYLVYENKIKQITKDHSIIQRLIDSGEITPEESQKHPSRNELTNVVGLEDNFFAEVLPEPISLKNDYLFLLCTDGLYSLVEDNEMLKIISEVDFANAVNTLIEKALQRGGNDNITAVIIKVSDVIYKSNFKPNQKNEDVFSVPKLNIEEKSFKEKYKKYLLPFLITLGAILVILFAVFIFKGKNYYDGNVIPDTLLNRDLSGTDSKIERILYYLYSGFTLPDSIEFSVSNVRFITKNGSEKMDSLKLISALRMIPVKKIDFEGKSFVDKDIKSWMYRVTYHENEKKLQNSEYKIDYLTNTEGMIVITGIELLSENKSEELISVPPVDTLSKTKKENSDLSDSLKNRKIKTDTLKKTETKKDTLKKTATLLEENKSDTSKNNKLKEEKNNDWKVKEKIKTELNPDTLEKK